MIDHSKAYFKGSIIKATVKTSANNITMTDSRLVYLMKVLTSVKPTIALIVWVIPRNHAYS